jgi:hypothetical protein
MHITRAAPRVARRAAPHNIDAAFLRQGRKLREGVGVREVAYDIRTEVDREHPARRWNDAGLVAASVII